MNRDVGFFNFSINKILTKDQSILDQARIRLLYYGLWLGIIAVAAVLINILIEHRLILSFNTSLLLLSLIILFKYLTFRPRWGIISHILLVLATMVLAITLLLFGFAIVQGNRKARQQAS